MQTYKKIILLGVFLFFISPALCGEEVYLDLNLPDLHSYDTGSLDFHNEKKSVDDDENYLKPSFYTIKKMFDEDFCKPKMNIPKKEKTFENPVFSSNPEI